MRILKLLKKNYDIRPQLLVTVLNIFIVIFLIVLPFFLFKGRLFLGGDDTRFYYAYPSEFLNSLALYSWNNISSLPYYIPNHYWMPFVFALSLLDGIFNSKILLLNMSFSSVLILGFIYFQKFIRELIGEERVISFVSSLIYVLSPITLVSIWFFLAPVWLIALFPIVAYYYLCFIHRGKGADIVKAVIWSILFSFVYFSIPWILGFAIPLIGGLIFVLIFVENPFKKTFKRTIIFGFFIVSSQLFWLIPFARSLVSGGSAGLGTKVVSSDLAISYRNTVLSTATDNIVYPLLNLYHRKMVFEFGWHLKDTFTNFYDHILPINIIFIVILFLGVIKFNQVLPKNQKKIYIFFLASFIVALYFCTINIGFLKEVFILLGSLPGFAILRNFTDKFALSYIIIYSTLLALSLYVIKKSNKFYGLILAVVVIVTLINFIPTKQVISYPLWKTKNVYTTVNLPEEYMSFVKKAKLTIPNTTNVIAFPQNITAYAIIAEDNGINTYVGTSPFKFFTGINDLTGTDSYPPYISVQVHDLIMKRDYENLLKFLSQINTGYVMVSNNIPEEVKKSYLFDRNYIKLQDKKLIDSIAGKQVLKSSKGNYVIYKLKNSPQIISSSSNIQYRKISPIDYEIKVKNLKGKQQLLFNETYHPGWKLYVTNRGSIVNSDYSSLYPLGKSVFDNSHKEVVPYGNSWVISPDVIKDNFNNSSYKENKDGSIDVAMHLYFFPQTFFYIGIIMTILFLSVGGVYFLKSKEQK